MGGPTGSQREPEDLSEATAPPRLGPAAGASTWGTASIQLHPTQSCVTSRRQDRLWAPKRSRSSALCKATLVPTIQTLLQPETPSLLPAPNSKPSPTYPYAFSGDASPFSELMSLRGTAVAWPFCTILHRGHRPFSSLLRYKHVHCGNRITRFCFLNLTIVLLGNTESDPSKYPCSILCPCGSSPPHPKLSVCSHIRPADM